MNSRAFRGRQAMVLGLVAAVGLAILAAFATAKLKEKSTDFRVANDDVAAGTAKCKKGQAVAGGFDGEFDPSAAGAALVALDSTRVSKKEWRYRAANVGDQPGTATALVYCGKGKPGLEVKKESNPTQGEGTLTTAKATCADGSEAVAGGFDGPNQSYNIVESRRDGKQSWRVSAIAAAGFELTAFAYCNKREPGLKTKETSAGATGGEIEAVKAKCKRKQDLVSGGFENQAVFMENVGFPIRSQRAGKRRWKVTSYAVMGSPDLTTYAYCEKKD